MKPRYTRKLSKKNKPCCSACKHKKPCKSLYAARVILNK